MGLLHCSEFPSRKTRGSEGLNTHWSPTPVTVKVTTASGGLATKSFLAITIPDTRGNSLPGSQNGCQQPLLLQFRRIPAHSLLPEGREAGKSFTCRGGAKKCSCLCCRSLGWKAALGRAQGARQLVAGRRHRCRVPIALGGRAWLVAGVRQLGRGVEKLNFVLIRQVNS